MKRVLLAIFALVAFSFGASAQSIVINENEGTPVELDVEGLRSISFKDGKMVVSYSDGTDKSYVMSTISRLDFDDKTGVGMVSLMDGKVSYSEESGLLVVAGTENSHLSVYNLGGTLVFDKVIEQPVETVDLSGLQKGIYLLRLDGKTIKIVR